MVSLTQWELWKILLRGRMVQEMWEGIWDSVLWVGIFPSVQYTAFLGGKPHLIAYCDFLKKFMLPIDCTLSFIQKADNFGFVSLRFGFGRSEKWVLRASDFISWCRYGVSI